MNFKNILKSALKSLLRHKSRSLLTILGIVIGIMSITIIVSAGNSATHLITGELQSLGSDIIWIEPGREPEGPTEFAQTALTNTIKERDIRALQKKSNVPGALEVVPAVSIPGSISYRGETYRPLMMGFSAEFMSTVFDLEPKEGFLFGEAAIADKERVAVLGASVAEELFGSDSAVGKIVKIKDQNFRVTGVLAEGGQVLFFDIGELVIVPYSTAQTYLTGTDHYNEVWVRVADVANTDSTVEDIKATIRELHGISDPDKDDFHVLTQANLLDQTSGIIDIMTNAVAAIAAIALLVGGVGIMNIMLVSVTERTREIGLRKALGATTKDIMRQFLTEAVLLTSAGGILGVASGALIVFLLSLAITAFAGFAWSFQFSIPAATLGVLISSLVGLVFGLYPARKASERSPIEALRYE
ncbi:MAG: ABC transporter permease [bacterium]|nr:ABC transporter permease [bacterium]